MPVPKVSVLERFDCINLKKKKRNVKFFDNFDHSFDPVQARHGSMCNFNNCRTLSTDK